MKHKSDPELADWMAKAEADLKGAVILLDSGAPLFDLVCFHSQQAAEKSLKALLVAMELEVPRIHDLVALAQAMAPSLSIDPEALQGAASLTPFAVLSRYPGFGTTDRQTAERAVSEARHIVAMMHKALG